MEQILEKALDLRGKGKLKESKNILIDLVQNFPNHASLNYQCAWSFDVLGEETRAVPYYEKAIKLGLPKKELEGALIGLGSTYRTIGEYEKSKETFQKGLKLFPNNHAIKVFYSMTLYNLEEYQQAMEVLLLCLVNTTTDEDLLNYEKAIRFYANKLNETW
ncbi:tetratricopeptide repeat protein [Ureibacillus sp. FSL E2-3493]|uniref:tetratricopeptide repeat protein n=1 Tax=Ureibacillus sp. FSL E2-3493 TaxID=2921367 RepID=UPI0031193EF9